MIIQVIISFTFFSFIISLTDVRVVTYGLLPVENPDKETLQWDQLNAFDISTLVTHWENFNISFSGWIDTGPSQNFTGYQSKILILKNAAPYAQRGMFFGNNSTHFVIREDLSSSVSKAECSLAYSFNQKYHFYVSMQQKYYYQYWLYFLLALKDENGTITYCTSSETKQSNLFQNSYATVAFQIQNPSSDTKQSTQMMGAISIISDYSSNSTDPDLLRFLLNFGPNSYEVFHFQFSYEFPYCNCLIDSSENTLQGTSSISFYDLTSQGGGGFFIFGFTQNEVITFKSGKLRFGAKTDTLYRDLNYTRLTDYKSTQSISLSFWMNISSSVTSFTVFKYITPLSTFQLSTSANGDLFSLLVSDGSSSLTLNSSIAPNFYHHFIIAISSRYLDFYVNGTFASKSTGTFKTFFQGGIPEGVMSIGGSNIPATSTVQLSQFRLFSSNTVLGSLNFATGLISNCQALIQNRTQTYSCLLCQNGYFLKTLSQCVPTCGTGFKTLTQIRTCVPQCPFGCNTCDLLNPKKCLTCNANRVLRANVCECPTGTFEGFRMASCFKEKKFTSGYDVGQFEMNKVTSVIIKFVNPFPTPPQVVFSLLSYSYELSQEVKPFFISATSITETLMQVSSNTDQLNYLHVQYFAYDSANPLYMSGGLSYNFTRSSTVKSQTVNKGTYFNTHLYRITPLFAGIGCLQNNLSIVYNYNRCIYQFDWNVNQITVTSWIMQKQTTFVYLYYLLTPTDPDINCVSDTTTYLSLFSNEVNGIHLLEKTSQILVPKTLVGASIIANHEIISNADILTSMERVYWSMNNFSYMRLAQTNYYFTSASAMTTRYEQSVHTNEIQDTQLTVLMLYEKYNYFALCQYVDFYSMKCLRCTNGFAPDSLCTSCLNGQQLIGGQCICPSGTWEDALGVCNQCDISCATCSSQEDCTVCKGDLVQIISQEGHCACSNPLKWQYQGEKCVKYEYFFNRFDTDGSCAFCQSTCETCHSGASCTSCYSGMSKAVTGFCECPSQQWFQEITLTCQPCYFLCSSCFDLNNSTSHNCNSCNGGRDLSSGSCICNGSNDPRIFLDDIRCSKDQTAVLNSVLSANFLTLTIDFGTQVAFNPIFSSSSTTLCSNIFTSISMLLIGSDSVCSLISNGLNVALGNLNRFANFNLFVINSLSLIFYFEIGSMARVLNGDTLFYNTNSIKFTYNGFFITEFARSYVIQNSKVTSSLVYSSPTNFKFCSVEKIQVDSLQNDGGRGISSVLWSYVQMTPMDAKAFQSLSQSIQDSNIKQSPLLILKMFMAAVNFQFQVTLSWVLHVGQSGSKAFTVNVKRQKTIFTSFSLSEPSPYFLYKDLIATINFQISICTENGDYVTTDDSVNLRLQNSVMGLDETHSNISAREFSKAFPAYSLVSDYLYEIQVTLELASDSTTFISDILAIQYQLSDLQVLINGGNRYVNFKKPFNISSTLTDYEIDNKTNPPSGIIPIWVCQEASNTSPCIDQVTLGAVTIPSTQDIGFPSYQFPAFTAIKIILTGSKAHITLSGTTTRERKNGIVVFVTEMDIPPLEIWTDARINVDSTINLNQIIHATLNYDKIQNPNNLYYAGAILYNSDLVQTMEFKYNLIRFQIWDYYSQFDRAIPDFSIRFSAYNPQFILPSLTTILFTINFPPKDCVISISVDSPPNYALETIFNIIMSNCDDDNTPLMYQYFYYDHLNDFILEKENPLKVQRKQLSDKTSSSNLKTILPAGNIEILVQAIDSRDAIANCTTNVSVITKTYTSSIYSPFVSNFILNTQVLQYDQQIINLNFLTSDLINRGASLMAQANLDSIKLQIIDLIQIASSQLLSSSFLYQLGYQAISQLLSSSIQMTSTEQINKLASLNDGLTAIQSKCTTSGESQQKYQKCIENIYLTFKQVDGLSQNAKQSEASMDASFVQLSEQMGDIQNSFALPNENSIVYSGSNLEIKTQKITSKLLVNYVGIGQSSSEIDSDTEIYDAAIKVYSSNFYSTDPSFQKYQESVTQALNTTKMVTVFPVINPSITIKSNSSLLNTTRGNIQSFKNLEPSRNLTCISKSNQNNKEWVTSECSTRKIKFTNEIQCICPSLSPTTIVEDISSLFTNNENLNTAFSSQGFQNLSNFTDFYRYIAFWVLSLQTLALILFIIKGRMMDQIQYKLLNKIGTEKELKDDNQVKQVVKPISISKVVPIQTPLSENHKQSINTPIFSNVNAPQLGKRNRKPIKLTAYNEMNVNSFKELDKQSYPKFDLQILLGIPNSVESKNLPQIDSLTHIKEIYRSQEIGQQQIEQKKLIKEREEITKISANSDFLHSEDNNNDKQLKQVVCNKKSKLRSLPSLRSRELQKAKEITEEDKLKLRKINKFFFFLYFHDFFSIFLVYLPNLSRQVRFILFYLRYSHTLAISIMFSSLTKSLIQTIFVSIFSSVIITFFSKVITILLLKKGILSKIGALFTISVVLFYLYMILSVQSGQKYYQSNEFFWGYVQFLGMDVLFSQTITAFIHGIITKKILEMNEGDHQNCFFRLFDFLKLNIIITSLLNFS